MTTSCKHPARKLHTGHVHFPGITPSDIDPHETMWVACCACGQVIRQAPHALEIEALVNAQNAELEAA